MCALATTTWLDMQKRHLFMPMRSHDRERSPREAEIRPPAAGATGAAAFWIRIGISQIARRGGGGPRPPPRASEVHTSMHMQI